MAIRELHVVGKSLPRFDAPGKVTGTAVYAADFALPGMLVGKVFRSTQAHARIALGAVAPTTWRAREAERLLEGRPLTPEAMREAGRAAAAGCRPIGDVRASARYRRLLVETLVPRALARCLERIE